MAKILIADDNEMHLRVVAAVIQNQGHKIYLAENGEKAMEMALKHRPDLLLLDIDMPGRDGIWVLETLRASDETKLLPIVMMTGSSDPGLKRRATEAGATDFISKPFDAQELVARVKSLLTLKFYTDELENAHDVLVTLAQTIDARDSYTARHSARVAHYAVLLGQRIGLPKDELKDLRQGAFFHDFGKIAVRDDVLLKPGPLTDEERKHMQIHPAEGSRLMKAMKSLAKAVPIIRHHHERLDGSGYPDGLTAGQIPINVRVAAIADVFDALTTTRCYRESFSVQEGLKILEAEAKKGWWDPGLVDEFRAVGEKLRSEALPYESEERLVKTLSPR